MEVVGKWLCRHGWHKLVDRRIGVRGIKVEITHAECLRCGLPRKDTKACGAVYGYTLAVERCHGWFRDFPHPYRHDSPEEQARQRREWGIGEKLVRRNT